MRLSKSVWFSPMVIFFTMLLFTICKAFSQETGKYTMIDTLPFKSSANHWYGIYDKDNIIAPLPGHPCYPATNLIAIGDNILLFQKTNGGWPKNYDMQAILNEEQIKKLVKAKTLTNTTFDNGTTYTQIECLANIYTTTKIDKYKTACIKGVDFMLEAQFDNGGWPQYYPLEKGYSRHITYNDDAMIGILSVLKDIVDHATAYSFVEASLYEKAKKAYLKGIDCILQTQIKEKGVLTAWCQQHDENTLAPAWARAFEPPSICNNESAGIVLFLMSIDHPSPEVIKAVVSAVQWFENSKIQGIRIKTIPAPALQTKYKVSVIDRIVVEDATAPPIWTRFYELGTHKPLFCNRDSKVVYSLAEVDRERRDGYGWYTYEPQKVLKAWPEWKKKWVSDVSN